MITRHLGTLYKPFYPNSLTPKLRRAYHHHHHLRPFPFLVFLPPSNHLQLNHQPLLGPRLWAPHPHAGSRKLTIASFFFHFTPLKAVAVTEPQLASSGTPLTSFLMFKTVLAVLFIGFLAWQFQAIRPPPPQICGSPGGPPVTGPRIKLRDGRHLAYKEHGVPKGLAKYKVVLIHGFSGSKHEGSLATANAVQELGVYFVSFDRPGYGESDPDPKRSFRSLALDIEELAEQLELGTKFYIIGNSMGGQVVWGCLKYISHRLAGAALIVPVINYWWPGFPSNLSTEAYYQQFPQDQWALRVAHYAPWLIYWWNTQKVFPASSVIAGRPKLSRQDLELLSKLGGKQPRMAYVTQQGVFESFHMDLMVGFGKCEFDPMDLKNPFGDGEGSVHLWQGAEDALVPVKLQRYIVEKLPWIHYHEIAEAGHLVAFDDGAKEAILNSLLTGEKK